MSKEIRKMIDKVKKFKQFVNENYENILLSEIVDGEIKVYENTIRKLLGGIGDGIYSIDVESETMSGRWTPNTDEYQNEISIIFIDNAWGGIDIDEWNNANNKLKILEGKNGFYSFTINSSRNLITLEFDGDLPMGLY